MNLNLHAECIVYVPAGRLTAVTLVNPDKATKEALKALRPWQNVENLVFLDQTAEGRVSQSEVSNVWFIDALPLDTTADVMMVRFVPRPDIQPISSEIKQ